MRGLGLFAAAVLAAGVVGCQSGNDVPAGYEPQLGAAGTGTMKQPGQDAPGNGIADRNTPNTHGDRDNTELRSGGLSHQESPDTGVSGGAAPGPSAGPVR